MIKTLSSPIGAMRDHYDVVVIGSGYGGGIAASRLARAGKSVCVLERGEERQPGHYPNDAPGLLKDVQLDTPVGRTGSRSALFDVRYNKDINIVVGCGLGGTSLINAGISLRPDPKVLDTALWPSELRKEAVLDPFFAHAEAMLKPSRAPEQFLTSSKTIALGYAAAQLHTSAQPVPVLVNFQALDNNVNHVGVTQFACVGCGDCVSGCNYHAKNTVLMNYLPDAKNHSAEIFTRARAQYLEKTDQGWLVHGESTAGDSDPVGFKVSATIVVLAAGTLGSTEILLRSGKHGLPLSAQLGSHFSANGDSIGFAYNSDHVVHGIGLGTGEPDAASPIGPCSTAMIDWRGDGDASDGMVMEDGAIPGALADVLAPLLAVVARTLGSRDDTDLRGTIERVSREAQSELHGAHVGATGNTLFMLLIAYDDSKGRMFLDNDRLRVDWPGLGNQPQFETASRRMRDVAAALGGTYIQNPIWNELTNHSMVTGHPLGGCVMAEAADSGVVNHKGQVFSGASGPAVHPGLYVMDGSVVPTALGVNPLLTISALAERSCHELAQELGWVIQYA